MTKDTIMLSAKIEKGTDLYENFQDFQEDYETRAEAIRAAVRRGVDAQKHAQGGRPKWVRFGEYLHVTAVASAAILFFGFLISLVLLALGWALAAPPGLLAVLALAGVAVAVLARPLTQVVRWLDDLAVALARRLGI